MAVSEANGDSTAFFRTTSENDPTQRTWLEDLRHLINVSGWGRGRALLPPDQYRAFMWLTDGDPRFGGFVVEEGAADQRSPVLERA